MTNVTVAPFATQQIPASIIDLTTPATADRRLIELKRWLLSEAYALADEILREPDPVRGTEMLGRLKETVQTAELVQAILDAGVSA